MSNIRFVSSVAALWLGAAPADAVIRHVPSEYATIQAAIDASVSGDVVSVAPGTYTDSQTRNLGIGDFTACVFLAGGVTLRSEAGPEVTIIDMQQAPGPQPDVVLSVVGGQYTVEGFTITGVRLNGHGAFVVGEVTFRDCIFRDMDAGESTGGGIAANANLILERCEFVNCLANGGGAIYHANGTIEMYDCAIRQCGSTGVLLVGDPGGPVEASYLLGCTFHDCWGRALSIQQHHGGSSVRNCYFIGNAGSGATGAVSVSGFPSTPKIVEGCLFWNNSAPGSNARGGGLSVGGPVIVRSNTFYGNTCVATGGAAVSFSTGASGELSNNVLVNNTSDGGAVYAQNVPLAAVCNVFWENAPGTYYTPGSTDRIVDPLLCDPVAGDFELMVGSPCLPPGSIGCGQIGAFGAGSCGVITVDPSSWGEVKAAYRGEEGDLR